VTFLEKSVGGHFKGKDPTIAIGILEARWLALPGICQGFADAHQALVYE
jgi:hypothetical protein